MALKLRSFCQPDQLKRFQPESLIRLLVPHEVFLVMKGWSFPAPDGAAIDLPALSGILAEPDEEMPSDLVEALHLIEHLGTDEHYDDLLQLAAENGIEPAGDATAPDLAAQVWLKNPQALERKDREGLFEQRKSFESFRAADTEVAIVVDDIPADLGPLEGSLGGYFEEKKRGVGCRVIRKDSPGEVRCLIQHGQPCKREPSRKGPLSTCTFFRPEKTDIVIVDGTGRGIPILPVGFSCKDSGADAIEDVTPTMRAMGHRESHPNAGGQLAVAFWGFGQDGFVPLA